VLELRLNGNRSNIEGQLRGYVTAQIISAKLVGAKKVKLSLEQACDFATCCCKENLSLSCNCYVTQEIKK
jgi:hypothetical protein